MDQRFEQWMAHSLHDMADEDRLMLPSVFIHANPRRYEKEGLNRQIQEMNRQRQAANMRMQPVNGQMQPVNGQMQPASQTQMSTVYQRPATPERTPQQSQSASAVETFFVTCRAGELSQITQSYSKVLESTPSHLQKGMLAVGVNECIARCHLDALEFLLGQASDVVGEVPRVPVDCVMIIAITRSRAFEPVMKLLIRQGYDMHRSYSYDGSGTTLLEEICGDEDRLKWCLNHGAEPERVPCFLDRLVFSGCSIPTFKSLKSRGASYCDPLDFAISAFGRRYNEMLGRPMQSNPNIAARQVSQPETRRAKKDEAMAMIKFLVEDIGIDVNSSRKTFVYHPMHRPGLPMMAHPQAGTPLHAALTIGPGAYEVISYLMAHGADPSKTNCCGTSVFDKALSMSTQPTPFLQLLGDRPES